jgi:dolichyl-phosphate beta-glucosyltransferase
MFTRRAAAVIFSNQRLQRWCFDVELIYIAQRLGVPISGEGIREECLLHA